MIRHGLIIAGFDPSAGAGLLMDIKVFSAIGVYAFAVPTAIVEENTDTVKRSIPIIPSVFEGQLRILLEYTHVDGVKIGMLSNSTIVEIIQKAVHKYKMHNIVLDPVLASSSGKPLFRGNIKEAFQKLMPLCNIITPNIPEASLISGIQILSKEDMILSARYFINNGANAVVIKGGHFVKKGLDLYMDQEQHVFLDAKPVNKDVHGTGCIFSSAISAYMIKGYKSLEAVKKAKTFTYNMIKKSIILSPRLKRYVGTPLIK
ncbi:MAG: bifunctional hydroxymethylpyrimidine kinase/phosphomethylpyrimidine kinase [bacterium]